MTKNYKKPPIIEALCEFQFTPDSAWDLTMPGLMYDKVHEIFPTKRQAQQIDIELIAGPQGLLHTVCPTYRMQFFRQDEKALIQVGQHLLSVNHLKPYPSWPQFVPLIRTGFETYQDVAHPKGIQRIGLRYINRVELQSESLELSDYFEFYPMVGPKLNKETYTAFLAGIQIPYEDARDILKIELANAIVTSPDALALTLDIDYFLAQPGKVALDAAFDWVEVAHSRVETAFEACIKPGLRELFEEVVD